MTHPTLPASAPARIVEEVAASTLTAVVHPEWGARFPWLVQGTTGSGRGFAAEGTGSATPRSASGEAEDFDLGLFSDASAPVDVLDRWERLRSATAMPTVAHAHQVHDAAVRWHVRGEPGLHLSDPCDGHATADAGVLLAVTVADCVPVSLVDPRRRAVALVHAGWRGAAAGILERGVAVLAERVAAEPGDLHVHLGPAICGRCYEVGPEIFRSLNLAVPDGPAPLDLRAALAQRAIAAGVPADRVTVSKHCTRCGGGFFSHRGGDRGRQVGFLGIRDS